MAKAFISANLQIYTLEPQGNFLVLASRILAVGCFSRCCLGGLVISPMAAARSTNCDMISCRHAAYRTLLQHSMATLRTARSTVLASEWEQRAVDLVVKSRKLTTMLACSLWCATNCNLQNLTQHEG